MTHQQTEEEEDGIMKETQEKEEDKEDKATYIHKGGEGSKILFNFRSFAPADVIHVTVHQLVKDIGNYAFFECMELESILVPEGVQVVGERAFCECDSISMVELPITIRE
eukprot:7135725-Ditylum_brightwellii.AAC.1